MIFLLYKPIICLGPCFTPASDAARRLCVALTVQLNIETECLNRIYRLAAFRRIRRGQSKQRDIPHHSLLGLAPRAFSALSLLHHSIACSYYPDMNGLPHFLCTAASKGFSLHQTERSLITD
jgi:hypothetical protein